MTNGTPTLDVNCRDYRKSMELLGLKRQLEKGIPDPQARDAIVRRIETLEKELGLD
jgi:hypothetical protein